MGYGGARAQQLGGWVCGGIAGSTGVLFTCVEGWVLLNLGSLPIFEEDKWAWERQFVIAAGAGVARWC